MMEKGHYAVVSEPLIRSNQCIEYTVHKWRHLYTQPDTSTKEGRPRLNSVSHYCCESDKG